MSAVNFWTRLCSHRKAFLLGLFAFYMFLSPWPWDFPSPLERVHIGLPVLWLLGWCPWRRPRRLILPGILALLPLLAFAIIRIFFWKTLVGGQIRPLPMSERLVGYVFIESGFILFALYAWALHRGVQLLLMKCHKILSLLITLPLSCYACLVYGVAAGSLLKLRIPMDSECPMPHEEVQIKTSDGLTLQAWYIPGSKPGLKAIVFHCASCSRGNTLKEARLLYDRGFTMLLFDQRGHGNSQGHLNSLGPLETRDMRAALDYFNSRTPLTEGSVFVTGQSLGAILSVMAGGLYPEVGWVAAHASYADLPSAGVDLGRHFVGPLARPVTSMSWRVGQLICGVDYRENSPLAQVDKIAPDSLFLSHGTVDFLIPFSHAERLIAKAKDPKQFHPIPDLNHMGSPYGDPQYEPELLAFIDAFVASRMAQ